MGQGKVKFGEGMPRISNSNRVHLRSLPSAESLYIKGGKIKVSEDIVSGNSQERNNEDSTVCYTSFKHSIVDIGARRCKSKWSNETAPCNQQMLSLWLGRLLWLLVWISIWCITSAISKLSTYASG
ncbi:uncharacterized protein LOC129969538 isoform X2 [Argiope bruennichi]|uniref:uncharacterized protein LOC129969538 isoform X2 n=1 Tax=Argiope bruennichi TaxID=94029 RepID=UPI0024944BCC|nr:uncharacterized protein LOC129969538 isoform X2 [Argiope bruennichi]